MVSLAAIERPSAELPARPRVFWMYQERKRQERRVPARDVESYPLDADVRTTLLVALVEGAEVESLEVRIFDPVGGLVAEAVPVHGAAVATAVPALPGEYTIEILNPGDSAIDFQLTTIRRQPG